MLINNGSVITGNIMRLYEINEPKAIPRMGDYLYLNYRGMDDEERLEILRTEMEFVKQECSQIISAYRQTNKVLFRGIGGRKPEVIELDIRKDRRPVEMDLRRHELIIDAYKYGDIAAHRGNSIFTSPVFSTAETWGNVYIVFPKNGFRFSYFKNYTEGRYAFESLNYACEGAYYKYRGDEIAQAKYVFEKMREMGITEQNLPYAIENGCEVLFTGNSYYAFDASDWSQALRTWIRQ